MNGNSNGNNKVKPIILPQNKTPRARTDSRLSQASPKPNDRSKVCINIFNSNFY
jgi:hypothetical protein